MTLTQKILDKVLAEPGLDYLEIVYALNCSVGSCYGILRQLLLDGKVSRVRVPCKAARWYPPDGKPIETKLGSVLILKSRGFHGVDIDAVHYKRCVSIPFCSGILADLVMARGRVLA